MGYVLLAAAAIMGLAVLQLGRKADWHWSAALLTGPLLLAFTYSLGMLGLLIGGDFVAAVRKATNK